ncbi:MOSC domain-containing protein [bacterium]|nr:MOSC domain-containing protein [bacterium]MCI0607190.1 MOSC domain-containing protein [bacterium]
MSIKYRLEGEVVGVFIGRDPISLITTRERSASVSFSGFDGNRQSGMTRLSDSRTTLYTQGAEIRNDRQVSIVSIEELSKIAEVMDVPEILPEWMGANLLFRNVPKLTELPPSTRLSFSQGAVLVVQKKNLPCIHPGRVIEAHYPRNGLYALFRKSGLHRRGVVACVEKPGVIAEADQVIVEVPEQVVYTLEREPSFRSVKQEKL